MLQYLRRVACRPKRLRPDSTGAYRYHSVNSPGGNRKTARKCRLAGPATASSRQDSWKNSVAQSASRRRANLGQRDIGIQGTERLPIKRLIRYVGRSALRFGVPARRGYPQNRSTGDAVCRRKVLVATMIARRKMVNRDAQRSADMPRHGRLHYSAIARSRISVARTWRMRRELTPHAGRSALRFGVPARHGQPHSRSIGPLGPRRGPRWSASQCGPAPNRPQVESAKASVPPALAPGPRFVATGGAARNLCQPRNLPAEPVERRPVEALYLEDEIANGTLLRLTWSRPPKMLQYLRRDACRQVLLEPNSWGAHRYHSVNSPGASRQTVGKCRPGNLASGSSRQDSAK
jgi:hypothetical protein